MRRRALLVLALPLAVLSGLAGHLSAYALVGSSAEDVRVHGYLGYAPLVVAGCGALVAVALILRVAGSLRGRPAAWPYALLPPLVFAAEELLERVLAGLPASAVLERAVFVGLAAQIPLAVAAYLAARALLRVADAVASAFASRPPVTLRSPLLLMPAEAAAPRRQPLAFERLGRAPPPR